MTPSRSRWTRSSTTSGSTRTGTHAELDDRRRRDDARGTTPSRSPDDRRPGTRSTALRKSDVDHFANHCRDTSELLRVFRTMINNLFPVSRAAGDTVSADSWDQAADADPIARTASTPSSTSSFREDLQRGRIGLARNRLPVDTDIRGCRRLRPRRTRAGPGVPASATPSGEAAIRAARSPSSRWPPGSAAGGRPGPGSSRRSTRSSCLAGKHRSFLEMHLAKTRRTSNDWHDVPIPHVVTTSYLTHAAIERHLARTDNYGYDGPVLPVAGAVDRPAADPDGARPDVPLGGRGARGPRRQQAEGPRRRPPGDPRMGPVPRARGPTTPTTSRSSGSTRPATSTRSPTCSATAILARLLDESSRT